MQVCRSRQYLDVDINEELFLSFQRIHLPLVLLLLAHCTCSCSVLVANARTDVKLPRRMNARHVFLGTHQSDAAI